MRCVLASFLLATFALADEAAVKALAPTLWLKSYKGLTVTSDFKVSIWADQSGNGRNFTQSVDASRPRVSRGDNRENTALNSSDPDSWGVTRASWIDSNVTAPDGSATADTYVAAAGLNSHFTSWAGNCVANNRIRSSLYAKKKDRDWVALSTYNGSAYKTAYFNIDTGTVGTVDGEVVACLLYTSPSPRDS